jgi:hypothetical protein
MSLEQIKREFPFLWQVFPIGEFWPGATVEVKVSRLSFEALFLPVGEIQEKDLRVSRELYAVDAKGDPVIPDGKKDGEVHGPRNRETIGTVLLKNFWSSGGQEYAEETCYVLYTSDTMLPRWRTRKGGKHFKDWRSSSYEGVIFKMPKSKTLWELIRQFHRQRRAMMRR